MRLSCPAPAEKYLAVGSLKLGQYAHVNECSLEKSEPSCWSALRTTADTAPSRMGSATIETLDTVPTCLGRRAAHLLVVDKYASPYWVSPRFMQRRHGGVLEGTGSSGGAHSSRHYAGDQRSDHCPPAA